MRTPDKPRGEESSVEGLRRRIDKLSSILEVAKTLTVERDLGRILETIFHEAVAVVEADRCSLFLIDRKSGVLRAAVTHGFDPGSGLELEPGQGIAGATVAERRIINLADAYEDPRFEKGVDRRTGYRTTSLLSVPMKTPQGEVVGVIQALNKMGAPAFTQDDEELLDVLAGQAASAVASALLHEGIEQLFEGFVRASILAIEARDPSTAGHSERVAELSLCLADVVEREDGGPFRGVRFTAEQRRELRYAALLHDFGKVGVREQVLVKAHKLHPWQLARIEERFNQALLAAQLELLEEHRGDRGRAFVQALDLRRAALRRGLALVRHVNEGGPLPPEDASALQGLAAMAFLDGNGERQPLLTHEEVHALSIARGTLSPEERREIERHVTHTYRFLCQIPWTEELRRVPDIAHAHHEKLDGSGYPLGLSGSEVLLEARIMAVADIYDALTVNDRPYRRAITREFAYSILEEEASAGKIDGDLVRLFIAANVPERVSAS